MKKITQIRIVFTLSAIILFLTLSYFQDAIGHILTKSVIAFLVLVYLYVYKRVICKYR